MNDEVIFTYTSSSITYYYLINGVKSLKIAAVNVVRTCKIHGKASRKTAKIATTRGANENV